MEVSIATGRRGLARARGAVLAAVRASLHARRLVLGGVCALATLAAAAPAAAQRITGFGDRATAERTVPARLDTATAEYTVGGIRVIHRHTTANDIIAVNLYLLGGSRQVTFANAGIEPMLLLASERGTQRYAREELRRLLARTGSSIVVSADRDWTVFGMRTRTVGFLDTWSAFADRAVAPRLDGADVAVVRAQALAAIAQRRDSPDGWVEHLADSVAFSGHAYGIDPSGTERSIGALTADALRQYHREQFVKSRMLLVVVGDVERRVLDSAITATLATLPQGNYRWTLPDTLPRRPTNAHREHRALPTNYLVGYAPGPRADHPDYDALRVACAILSGRLFGELRSRQTLTYAVHCPFRERAVAAAGLYVSTVDPVAALSAMREEIRALQDMRIDGRALAPLVQQFITGYFLEHETNAAQAGFLARAQLFRGDWRQGAGFSNALRAVTPADVQRVMRVYFRDLQFAYVGDPSALPDAAVRRF